MTLRQAIWLLVAVVGVASLGGCERRTGAPGSGKLPAASPRVAMAKMATDAVPVAPARSANDTMAYEHALSVEIDEQHLQARLDALIAACRPDAAAPCTVLDVQSSGNASVPSGSVRMRLAPAGVEPMAALAGQDARVINRSTHAEDLAQPLADTARELSLLTTHRDRLLELQKAKNLSVDQLITLSRELSSTQAQLESMASQQANLRRRVETELLSIELQPPSAAYGDDRTPIRDAFRSFGATLREAVAQVIGFVAMLLPWLVIGVPGLIGLRLLWRAVSRWLARRA